MNEGSVSQAPDAKLALLRVGRRFSKLLNAAGGLWLIVSGGCYLYALGHEHERLISVSVTLQFIGVGILVIAAIATYTFCRCPVCDKFIDRFEKRPCKNCGARFD